MTGGALAALAALGCALAVVGLVAADRAGSRAGVWVAKPLASTGFVLVALARGALETTYGRWVLAGLALGWLGDVLLIPKGARLAFAAGLGSFLLGHLAFAAGFVSRGQSLVGLGLGLAFVAAAALPLLRWLMPHVPGDLKLPVQAYFAVISAMVATAAGASGATRRSPARARCDRLRGLGRDGRARALRRALALERRPRPAALLRVAAAPRSDGVLSAPH